MKRSLAVIFITLLFSLLYLSCDRSPSSNPASENVPETKEAEKGIEKSGRPGGIEPDALNCEWRRTGPFWTLHHYEPKAGKIVGFSPGGGTPSWSEMRTKWGFTGILANSSAYQPAIDAGFQTSNMMVPLGPYDWQSVIDSYPAGKYYSGEPAEHDCLWDWDSEDWNEDNLALLADIRLYANQHGRKFVIDGYRRCSHQMFGALVTDNILYSSYRHWYIVSDPECWWPVSYSDQRSDWTDMKNLYGEKFASTWVGGHVGYKGDSNEEIPDLVGHAANLGLTEIWLYCGDGLHPGRLEAFTEHAWRNGYLRRFKQMIYYWWRCTAEIPNCEVCDQEDPEVWVFDRTEYVGIIQEEIP